MTGRSHALVSLAFVSIAVMHTQTVEQNHLPEAVHMSKMEEIA